MIIGVPKEILPEEKRVAVIPETVAKYSTMGFDVVVESGAGLGISISDEQYAGAGAAIAARAEEVYARSDVILKVKQPYFNENAGKHEVEMIREGSTLITFLHPAAPGNHDLVRALCRKMVTAFTMDGIPRISRAQKMDALTSMSTVTGYKSVLIAANNMQKFVPMIGTAIGTIKPAVFLIVGTGVVGLQAIATAKRLGAIVKAVDIREEAKKEAMSLGAKVVGFDVPQELAHGEGGYANALPAEWVAREREALHPHVQEADVIILSALVPGEVAPILITGTMLQQMNPGAVIMDISIDQGGNCEVTEAGKNIARNNVLICGIPNIPGRMAIHASFLYANNLYFYVENLFKKGLAAFDLEDEIVRHSLVTCRGEIVFKGALKAMGTQK